MILSFDPSTVDTGWGILRSADELVDYGELKPPSKDVDVRFHQQYEMLKELFNQYKDKVKLVVCEDQYQGRNAATAKKLVRVATMIQVMCLERGIPFEYRLPSVWRKQVHKNGSADKEETWKYVTNKFDLKLLKKQTDITDAIGVGLSYFAEKEV